MGTSPAMPEVAVLAKAPIPGFAKTRLTPALGSDGAAALQEQLIDHALQTAASAAIGRVTLWCAPDPDHEAFAVARRRGVRLARQCEGDLGARMLGAFEDAGSKSLVLIGTDCPCLTADDLRRAAEALAGGWDTVIAPAEDGGYGLIGAVRPIPQLFDALPWSTPRVAALTRERAAAAGLALAELRQVWDVDTPDDYRRLVASGLLPALPPLVQPGY